MKKEVDRSKNSNIKCEHCVFWDTQTHGNLCMNKDSKFYLQSKMYFHRCGGFKWKENGDGGKAPET